MVSKCNLIHLGFTLLELLCCLLLLSLLFLQNLPAIHFTLSKNQLDFAQDEIKHAVAYARKMALITNSRLALTPSVESNDWSFGVILFVDNKAHRYHSEKELLHQWQWHFPNIQIKWKGFQSSKYLLFSNKLAHSATSGHFDLFSKSGESRRLVVNRLGRVTQLSGLTITTLAHLIP